MTAVAARPLDAGWNWSAFRGGASGLKWNRRELASIAAVLELVPDRRVAVQAGGNLGVFPKALAGVFETVYTFEPAPDLFAMLVANAPEPNIIKFQAALGDAPKMVGLSRVRRDGKPDNHEGITHVAGAGNIPTLRLDALRLPVVSLLYLDIEGYELFALWGAQDTIRRCRPVIAVEINKSIEFLGLARDQVRTCLRNLGYGPRGGAHSDEFFVYEGDR